VCSVSGQVSDNVSNAGLIPGHYHRNLAGSSYMKEAMPVWGFLFADSYISLAAHRPALTALQGVGPDADARGYPGADFELRARKYSGLFRRAS
jgi:hypothetical protein